MRSRWIINIFLLILVAGLAWAVLNDVREARETTRLTGMDPAHIEGVELSRPGRDKVKLERITGGGWRMSAPYRIAADPERVARLLGVVRAEVVRSFPAGGVDLERLGLEPDPVRISLGGLTLRFGATEPIDGLRYVASGDLVHLIEDRYYHLLLAPPSDFVDSHPLPDGLVPASGDVSGEALDPATLTAIAALKAERVEPLDGDLTGRILSIQPEGDGAALRFLVSPDGLRWSRPDLRLTYLVASPPPVLVDPQAAAVGVAAQTEPDPRAATTGLLPEQAVGVVEEAVPQSAEGQPGPIPELEATGPSEGDGTGAALTPSNGEGSVEPIVDPGAPMEMRVERLAPDVPSSFGHDPDLDPMEARRRQIEDAVSASFGGPPVRSQAQIQREEAGVDPGEAIVSPEEAARPPPAVKLHP
jgi:Domain of unknown function (DUF4340)